MNFISFQFFLFILVSLFIFHALHKKINSRFIFLSINITFIYYHLDSLWSFLPFLAFFLVCFTCVKVLEHLPTRISLVSSLICILALFLYLKRYSIISFLPLIERSYLIVGLSYVLFRVLHLLIDIYGRAIKEKISFSAFTNYTLFFLSYISGPIQRYEDFTSQLEGISKKTLSHDDVYQSFSRLLSGYIKIGIISVLMESIFSYFRVGIEVGNFSLISISSYMCATFFYTMYLYYNFAGYMDIVIGIGQLIGINLPENFNKPFGATNFLEFWSRWHITLSEWFKFYLFNPIVKALTSRWTYPELFPYYGVFAYFITFFIMGIWHGSTYSFLVFGLFLGFGVSINKLYDVEIRRKLGKKKYNSLNSSTLYLRITSGLTVSYFCISLTCLWMGALDTLWLFVFLGGPVFFVLAFLVTVSKYFSHFIKTKLNQVSGIFSFTKDKFLWRQRILTLKHIIKQLCYLAIFTSLTYLILLGTSYIFYPPLPQNMPMDTLNSKETIWSIDRRYVLFNPLDVQSDSKNNLYFLDHQM